MQNARLISSGGSPLARAGTACQSCATPRRHKQTSTIFSDASGSWGCGAFWDNQWFQVLWQGLPISSASIAPKELFPILVASAVWGASWKGRTVCAHCNNAAVVEVIEKGRAKEPLLCHQLRALFFVSAFHDFELSVLHTPGRDNGPADALSRDHLASFRAQVPTANLLPSAIPTPLILGLSRARPFWRSQDWTEWFCSITTQLWPPQQ